MKSALFLFFNLFVRQKVGDKCQFSRRKARSLRKALEYLRWLERRALTTHSDSGSVKSVSSCLLLYLALAKEKLSFEKDHGA